MSKRLQVLLDERQLRAIRKLARQQELTVAEWVRQSLRAARSHEPSTVPATKLAAVRAAYKNAFPTGDIERMLAEIERGYLGATRDSR